MPELEICKVPTAKGPSEQIATGETVAMALREGPLLSGESVLCSIGCQPFLPANLRYRVVAPAKAGVQ